MPLIIAKHVCPYEEVDYYEIEGEGYIVWRRGTGDNVEMLHLKAERTLEGIGSRLIKAMLVRLRLDRPPYETVYGFCRTNNFQAIGFYERLGFDISVVKGVYRDGDAVVFSAKYKDLCERMLK